MTLSMRSTLKQWFPTLQTRQRGDAKCAVLGDLQEQGWEPLHQRMFSIASVFLQHLNSLQAYEAQVSLLARAMSRLEEEVQATRAEKASLLADLASVRELCVKLDSCKELTVRQLTAKSMELERVTSELEDMRSEAELLKRHLASEQLTVHNLETLLSTNRQMEFQMHLSASEKESEGPPGSW